MSEFFIYEATVMENPEESLRPKPAEKETLHEPVLHDLVESITKNVIKKLRSDEMYVIPPYNYL